MDNQKQPVAQAIKEANNVLVTVSANPSVDQLSACIGLTLALNKLGKHATAVFSGYVPSTIEFLQPEKTLEKNTDSLRDFIIALDKSKADKLRYKVEDRVVKIFITPYKTSISDKDLEFSQGDFNVDVVVALGVRAQTELDQAITAHGRILHDATVISINTQPGGELGTLNWLDPNASSLSELVTGLIELMDKKLIDGQIATALLTGIVAETDRFSNERTMPSTMSIAADLMANGANQQLVATKLEEPAPAPAPRIADHEGHEQPVEMPQQRREDGTLEIAHEPGEHPEAAPIPDAESHDAAPATPFTGGEHHDDAGASNPGGLFDNAEDANRLFDQLASEHEPHDDHTASALNQPMHDDLLGEGPRRIEPTEPTPEEAASHWAQPAGPVMAHHDEPLLPTSPELEATTKPDEEAPQIHIDEHGQLRPLEASPDEAEAAALLPKEKHEEVHKSDRPYLADPSAHPDGGGDLLGIPAPSSEPSAVNSLSLPDLDMPLLDRQPLQATAGHAPGEHGDSDAHPRDLGKIMPPAEVVTPTVPATDLPAPAADANDHAADDTTLSQIEHNVNSPHLSTLTPYETLSSDPIGHDTTLPEVPGTHPSEPPLPPVMPSAAPEPPAMTMPQGMPEPSLVPMTDPADSLGQPQSADNPVTTPAATDAPKDEQLPDSPTVEDARSAVERAISAMAAANGSTEPEAGLNTMPLGKPLHEQDAAQEDNPIKGATGIVLVPPDAPMSDEAHDTAPPPPVPPPLS